MAVYNKNTENFLSYASKMLGRPLKWHEVLLLTYIKEYGPIVKTQEIKHEPFSHQDHYGFDCRYMFIDESCH